MGRANAISAVVWWGGRENRNPKRAGQATTQVIWENARLQVRADVRVVLDRIRSDCANFPQEVKGHRGAGRVVGHSGIRH